MMTSLGRDKKMTAIEEVATSAWPDAAESCLITLLRPTTMVSASAVLSFAFVGSSFSVKILSSTCLRFRSRFFARFPLDARTDRRDSPIRRRQLGE